MRRTVFSLLVAALTLAAPQIFGQVFFVATLDGSQETPPVTTSAQGTAWAVLSTDAHTLMYGVTYADLSASFTVSHFHTGPPGVGGGVVHPITFTGNTTTGTWTAVPDSIIGELLAGNVYVNVHSSAHPGGEIRGQLTVANGVGFWGTLDQGQETPPTGSPATGTVWAVLDPTGTQLTTRVTVAGLDTNISVAHIHDGAPGVPGGVIHGLTFIDSSTTDVWTGLTQDNVIELMKGNLYVNVHTPRNPGGEIRGQLNLSQQVMFTASLDGIQETPPVVTSATGTAWAVLSTDLSVLTYGVTYAHLSGTFIASHFHSGAPGIGGPVIQSIAYNGNTASGGWGYPPDSIIGLLLQGNMYVNVHSSVNFGGEIRGQLLPVSGVGFQARLNGAQETPPNSSPATGTAWAILDSNGARITYHVTVAGLDTNITAAHFHDGAPGVPGGVVHAIAFSDSTSAGVWSGVPQNLAIDLMKGLLYVNAHTPIDPGGEIRGQLLFDTNPLVTGVTEKGTETPKTFALERNYPNPFNPTTNIRFAVPTGGFVSVKVYNVLGQQVASLVNSTLQPGSYVTTFDGTRMASGVYFYRMEVAGGTARSSQVLKMVLVK